MGVPQMYYTSCESGLAGYPGFQFNAATPGVDPGLLRRVEQGTSYEPPRSLGYQPTPAQMAACPVNLSYQPATGGEPAVLARTVFIGTDYSNRFGNYFVHALGLSRVEDDLDGALPIDFWRASFWARTEAATTDLPALRPERPSSSGPAQAEAFLSGSGRRGWLPRLLTAAERALVTGERSVVVVDADSERVAGWFAVVSHLLPPSMARRLSFATYSFRPARNPEHLVGTVPETDFAVDETTLRGHFVFDFAGGQVSELGAHPLAEMLTGMDAQDAGEVWALAGPLAAGTEQDFDDWYPVAVGGALRAGLPVGRDDLGVLVGWLAGNAARLRPAVVGEVVHRCLQDEALTAEHGTVLVRVAAASGDPELLAAAEIRAFDLLVNDLRGQAVAPASVPRPATEEGTRRATDLITAELNGPAGPRQAHVLLAVAVRAGLRLDRRYLDAWGRDLVTPILLAGQESAAAVPELLRHLPELRRSVLEALSAALPQRESLVLAATAGLGDAVPEAELDAHPALHRAVLIGRAAREPGLRVPTLIKVYDTGVPDKAVLAALWPQEWSLDEAVEVADDVPKRFWTSPAMIERLDEVLRRPDEPRGGKWPQYLRLCRMARDLDQLSPLAATHVDHLLRARSLVEERKTAAGRQLEQVLLKLLDQLQQAEGPARRYLESYLPTVLLKLDPPTLVAVLPAVREPLRGHYWDLVTETLQARPADRALAAALIEVGAQESRKKGLSLELEQVLSATVARWRSRDLDELEKSVDRSGNRQLITFFHKWREDSVPRGIGRFLPRRKH